MNGTSVVSTGRLDWWWRFADRLVQGDSFLWSLARLLFAVAYVLVGYGVPTLVVYGLGRLAGWWS